MKGDLIEQLEELRHLIHVEVSGQANSQILPSHIEGLKNLKGYLAIRKKDTGELHEKLLSLGLSGFDMAVGNSLGFVEQKLSILKNKHGSNQFTAYTISSNERLNDRVKALFGTGPNVHTMVTMPTEAAVDVKLVEELVKNGMTVARINCAHDSPGIWQKMIDNIRSVSSRKKASVKISMDLAGPKIRTNNLPPNDVWKMRPQRNQDGMVTGPFVVELSTGKSGQLQVEPHFLKGLAVGDFIKYVDARGKKRKLEISQLGRNTAFVKGFKTTYFKKGGLLKSAKSSSMLLEVIGNEGFISLSVGNVLSVYPEDISPVQGNESEPSVIGCTYPDILKECKPGDPVYFDDGKIKGTVRQLFTDHVDIEIVTRSNKGLKLKGDKGINLPKAEIGNKGLTDKDKSDLRFIVQHADIVNYSFVNSANDVNELVKELKEIGVAPENVAVILKIETATAFNNLPEILESAMQFERFGVMIARGDLAIEVGLENIGITIREISTMCRAASVPCVYATQVLENLAKTGAPSRSELVDATIASRADCIMLNKGPYIVQAMQMLHSLTSNFKKSGKGNALTAPLLKL